MTRMYFRNNKIFLLVILFDIIAQNICYNYHMLSFLRAFIINPEFIMHKGNTLGSIIQSFLMRISLHVASRFWDDSSCNIIKIIARQY